MGRLASSIEPKKPEDAEAALLLLESCGFHDTKVIPNRKDWLTLYKKYRNQVIHESYISNHNDPKTFEEFKQLLDHLYDMLLRIILKKVEYDGEYKRMMPYRDNQPLDWVQPNTSPQELGYK